MHIRFCARFLTLFLSRVVILPALLAVAPARGAEGVTEINLPLRGLVYDPFTEKLYGTSAATNNLLQIDPVTGAVTRTFDVGATPSHLELSAGRGIWVGLDGEGAVRRFNLDTFSVEEKIVVNAGTTIRDMAPSTGDPYTLAVATSDRTWLIRNGLVLPQASALGYVSMSENQVFGQLSPGSVVGKVEMTPNGFGGLVQGAGILGFFGDSEAFPDYLFHSSGRIYWPVTMALLGTMGPTMSTLAMADVTYNEETDELFYLAKAPKWVLQRFDRTTRALTGYGAFGPAEADPAYFNLQAWGTNHAAFHSREKLYLIELDELFLPADLGVSQSMVAGGSTFGTNLTITVTVTNKGPGAALNVVLTNFVETVHGRPANIRLQTEFETIDPASIAPIRTEFGLVPAGEERSFSIKFLPGSPGMFSNRVAVSASNEANSADNSATFFIPITAQDAGGITRVPLAAVDMASDRQTGEISVYAAGRLWEIDPTVPRISPLPGEFGNGTRIARGEVGDILYVGFHDQDRHSRFVSRVPGGPVIFGNGTIFDMEVSPVDSEWVAISQNNGTFLYRGSERLAGGIAEFGYVAFSGDGTKFYHANQQNCNLGIYNVTQNGLTLERTLPNVSCAEFTVRDGLLYFDSGLVFDPVTGARVPNTPVVTPPAYLIPTGGGAFDLFNRTNGTWVVRRFRSSNGTNFVQYAERQFPEITAQVVEVSNAGRDRIALRTAEEIILVDLPGDPDFMEAGISQGDGEVVIRFASTAGARYRIETTGKLQPAAWTTVQDNVAGDGSSVVVTVPMQNQTGFYRIVRLP